MSKPLSPRESEIKARGVPRHVGMIMDGNGRWAKARGLPRLSGHREGAKSVRAVIRTARRLGCEALTLYAFSAQNWERPMEEVEGLMGLLRDYLIKEGQELLETDIRLHAAGDLDRLPEKVLAPLRVLCEKTAGCGSMTLTLCLSYGGREELVHMARRLVEDVQHGDLESSSIDEHALAERLWTGSLPELDLIIRTSGEQRISNFLLWSSAYSELVFVPTLWPDFREEAFLDAIEEYQRRERRFGRATSRGGVAGASQ